MFDAVARRYDLSNDVMSLFQVHMWRRVTRAAVAARPGTRVLDLAAGTGTSSVEYAADGAEVVACDFSTGMVAEGKRRSDVALLIYGDDPAVLRVAERYSRTPAQVVLRWHVQRGDVVFPKSVTPARIAENFGLFDFTLSDADMADMAREEIAAAEAELTDAAAVAHITEPI